MSKLSAILKILAEDSVDAPSTSVMPGNSSQFSSPATNVEFTTIANLLRYKNGMDVGETKNKILGVPLQNILEELVTTYVQVQGLKARFKDAAANPVYRDKTELEPVFKRLDQCITTIESQIKAITIELDNLSLESSD